MAHAAAHIKKARSEMDQPPDLKALEKARERRRRSRERAERKRKVPGQTHGNHPPIHPFPHYVTNQCFTGFFIPFPVPLHLIIIKVSLHPYRMKKTLSGSIVKDGRVWGAEIIITDYPCPHLDYFHLHYHLVVISGTVKGKKV